MAAAAVARVRAAGLVDHRWIRRHRYASQDPRHYRPHSPPRMQNLAFHAFLRLALSSRCLAVASGQPESARTVLLSHRSIDQRATRGMTIPSAALVLHPCDTAPSIAKQDRLFDRLR